MAARKCLSVQGLLVGSREMFEATATPRWPNWPRVGFPGLTIEGVAWAANVNRTTIYRRWPCKGAQHFGDSVLAATRPIEGAHR
jgi:AcrR family transcriptional regulator